MQSEVDNKSDVRSPMISTIKKGFYFKFVKRPMDIILALIAIIISSPILLMIAVLIRIKLGKPILFKQERPGLNERIFTMYKFRTMTDERNENGVLLPDGVRLTKFGKFLRSTSLDELPELFNIIKGDMSIVGPRPQLIRDMVFMNCGQRKRHDVLPGLTGWAQINGRNSVSWERKLAYDLEYIEEITFLNDWNIICRTVGKVFNRDDINTKGLETGEDFGDYLLRKRKITEEYYHAAIEESLQLCTNYKGKEKTR